MEKETLRSNNYKLINIIAFNRFVYIKSTKGIISWILIQNLCEKIKC